MKRLTWDRLVGDVTLLIETTQQGDVGAGRCGKLLSSMQKQWRDGEYCNEDGKKHQHQKKRVSFLQI